ncbi:eukaryotic nuclear protein implicated in meiotic chromosome segregation [Schizosaccharomyces octosporus yFS286]|uniref:Eukaryotic nuclear protein implicated in meiotic chromosome segregation n=1 Tax=Schizosaccharomyces octosporus (strain yFS286) TaxID=483514 RepID=S9PUU6_SCHOY|nr:eukaryotic nuclear protein implicated in meiotic chromosome segregation [Schizosaccharomyces octosporus yFS286]EPX72896.1 eukaryotic nuclear protein implicated in meiotic chromosome segregation [Schizosaccharomyces octosporus yFS286]
MHGSTKMNQDDFRKLLATPRSETSELDKIPKRSQGLSFGRRHPRLPTSLPPRSIIKRHPNPKPNFNKPSSSLTEAGNFDTDEPETLSESDRLVQDLRSKLHHGEITGDEFSRRTQELGGDLSTTHLVRGLDRKLLQKAKSQHIEPDIPQFTEKTSEESKPVENEEQDDNLLEELAERTTNTSPKPSEDALVSSASTYIPRYPNGQPKYRRAIEEGKKVKYELDEDGNVLKRLVKKDKKKVPLERTTAHNDNEAPPLDVKKQREVVPLPKVDTDADIFEEAGDDYDPFHDDDDNDNSEPKRIKLEVGDKESKGNESNIFVGNLFADAKDTVQDGPKDFRRQIQHLASLQSRREIEDLKKHESKKKVDAGFGLTLANDDTLDISDGVESEDDEDGGKKRKNRK